MVKVEDAAIRQVLSEVAKAPVEIDRDESLFDSGVLDSFALADVVGALEQQFGVKIPDSDLSPRKFDSVAKIAQYLESHK